MDQNTADNPIINCHTHIFTVKDVPPFLAKSILPSPLHVIFRADWIARFIKWWTDTLFDLSQKRWYKKGYVALYKIRMALKRYFILRLIKALILIVILTSVFHDQYDGLIKPGLEENNLAWPLLDQFDQWLADMPFIITTDSWIVMGLVLCVLLLLFPSGRNILFAVLRQANRFLKLIPGKQTTELLKRYLNIIRFANYKEQSRVLSRLRLQYPPGTQHVILPMDMEFMGAGKPARPYYEQMKLLAEIKNDHPGEVHPFVFVDPRRIEKDKKSFFDFTVENNKVVLLDCFIKEYIEQKDFAGFKIYPALGYYPFDELLLPLWKYAADNGIPLMTHCIRGVIYYRGRKKPGWDTHPVFEQFLGRDGDAVTDDYAPMLLPQMKAVDVQEIFTHPLNYVCLYKKELLQKLVAKAKDERTRKLFGYNEKDGSITHDLSHLKLCFGHFGGEDEWKQFFEKDRANFSHQVIRNPESGIDFLATNGEIKRGKPEQLWKTADWYSIICSLMLQHPNIYADISYILHGDLEVMPLLRHTLQNPVLKTRVLYGTDFFVVRNHKSEKNMLADMQGGLLKEEFDCIARKNPVNYLKKG
jgi:predicted TIM-barrel fold metal-dependent hydrolase